jgi:hypothetical protein
LDIRAFVTFVNDAQAMSVDVLMEKDPSSVAGSSRTNILLRNSLASSCLLKSRLHKVRYYTGKQSIGFR